MEKKTINPRITLKSFKWLASLSHETLCFTAKVCVDGKVIGNAENAGHGGCTSVHLDQAKVSNDMVTLVAGMTHRDWEDVVDELSYREVDRKETDKALRRVLKDMTDKVCFLKAGESLRNGWRTWRLSIPNAWMLDQTIKHEVLKKYPDATILNGKTEGELRDMMTETK